MNTEKKLKFINDTLDRMERGLYTGVGIGTITDQIAWLWKFRKIDYETMAQLTDKATHIIHTYKPE